MNLLKIKKYLEKQNISFDSFLQNPSKYKKMLAFLLIEKSNDLEICQELSTVFNLLNKDSKKELDENIVKFLKDYLNHQMYESFFSNVVSNKFLNKKDIDKLVFNLSETTSNKIILNHFVKSFIYNEDFNEPINSDNKRLMSKNYYVTNYSLIENVLKNLDFIEIEKIFNDLNEKYGKNLEEKNKNINNYKTEKEKLLKNTSYEKLNYIYKKLNFSEKEFGKINLILSGLLIGTSIFAPTLNLFIISILPFSLGNQLYIYKKQREINKKLIQLNQLDFNIQNNNINENLHQVFYSKLIKNKELHLNKKEFQPNIAKNDNNLLNYWKSGKKLQYFQLNGYDSEWTNYNNSTPPDFNNKRLSWRLAPNQIIENNIETKKEKIQIENLKLSYPTYLKILDLIYKNEYSKETLSFESFQNYLEKIKELNFSNKHLIEVDNEINNALEKTYFSLQEEISNIKEKKEASLKIIGKHL